MNFALLLLRTETSLTETSSVVGLMIVNIPRGLISNCRRKEEEKKKKNKKKKTTAAKHYRDPFCRFREAWCILLRTTNSEVA